MGDMTLGMRRHGTRLAAVGLLLVLLGGLLASWIQTWNGIRIIDVRFAGSGGTAMSALLYVPATASAKSPAPGILAVHGYFNSREAQSGFAIEFARRGYVVLALDQTGHGYSDPPAFSNRFGGPDGLAYLRSLDFVDKNNIGLEGHSMGGWTVLNAAAAFPDGYESVVLEGSSTGPPFAPEGSTTFPRNLAVVFARFDEFSAFMWGAPIAREVAQSQKLQTAFGASETVQPGRIYGAIGQGNARVLHTPAGTHPFNHLSTEAIGHSIDWFQRTLDGGTPLDADDQIWPWKELGTTIAFAGCIVLMLGVFEWALGTAYFAPLANPCASATRRAGLAWWLALAVSVALPVLTFFPFLQFGERIAPASALWPQGFTNQIAVWALLNAVLIAVLSLLPGNARRHFETRPWRSVVLACLTVASAYMALALADSLFTIDFRFWFIALKLPSRDQVVSFLAYLVPFTCFFVLVLRALHTNLPLKDASPALQYAINIAALAGGFVLFVLVQYGLLFSTDRLLTLYMNDNLRTIIAIQFVPLMAIVAVISTFAFRRTDSYLPGAVICALFVTWYVVAGQATHVAR